MEFILEFSVCWVEPVKEVKMTEDVGIKTGFKSKIIHNYLVFFKLWLEQLYLWITHSAGATGTATLQLL